MLNCVLIVEVLKQGHTLLQRQRKLAQVHSIEEMLLKIGRDIDFIYTSSRMAEYLGFWAEWVCRSYRQILYERTDLLLGGCERVEEYFGNAIHDVLKGGNKVEWMLI